METGGGPGPWVIDADRWCSLMFKPVASEPHFYGSNPTSTYK